jgi:hypothetical protein
VRYRLGEGLEQEGRLLEAKDHYRELRDKGRDEAIAQRATYRLGLVGLRENDTAPAPLATRYRASAPTDGAKGPLGDGARNGERET